MTHPCNIPPAGWECTRIAGHDGPCAAVPSAGDLPDELTARITLDLTIPIDQPLEPLLVVYEDGDWAVKHDGDVVIEEYHGERKIANAIPFTAITRGLVEFMARFNTNEE